MRLFGWPTADVDICTEVRPATHRAASAVPDSESQTATKHSRVTLNRT